MPQFIDYTSRKIGRVQVLKCIARNPSRWRCKCDCGEEFNCLWRSFVRGETFECKKCMMERRRGIDLTGRKFGRWTVLEKQLDGNNKTVWKVLCDCGNYGLVATNALGKRGKSMSCGCLGRKEKSKWANSTLYPPSHLKSQTSIYAIRERILLGCYNEKNISYKKYGALGITVCELWRNGAKDFYNWCIENKWKKGFVVHLKEGLKEFSPTNCVIISPQESSHIQLSKKININGKILPVSEWAKIVGLGNNTILCRLRKGYSEEEAIFAKSHQNSGKKEWPDNEIKNLYESGLSLVQVGNILGFRYEAISKRLKFLGILIDNGMKKRKYKPRACLYCMNFFEPITSTHKTCKNCKNLKRS